MKITRSRSALQTQVGLARAAGRTIHFVPTMGALHAGHLALVTAAQEKGAQVVVSIFVNPTQFNQAEDLAKYPRQEAADLAALSVFDSLVVFLPSTATIYETGTTQLEHYDLGNLETLWEGVHRPGHFQGVCQVVSRLLNLVDPDVVFLGQKDYQQCLVLEKMMRVHFPHIALQRVATQRAASGLALSSRNQRLSPAGLSAAAGLYKSIQRIQTPGWELADWQAQETSFLLKSGFDAIEYLALADAETLEPLAQIVQNKPQVVLAAAYIEGVRLIDNLLFTEKA